jgi:hypothetical protein
MDIKQKIKELRLLPLFPDSNFKYTNFNLSDYGQVIDINDLREDQNLRFTITLFYSEKIFEKYVILGRVYNYENGEDFLNISKQYTKVGIFEAINKFNELYEELAKKFNELLLKELKEELEKEKQKAKEKEKDKQKDKEEEGESEEGEGEKGEEEEGEEEEGEGEKGEKGEKGEEGEDGEGEDGEEGEGEEGEGEEGEEGEDGEGQDGEGEDGEGEGEDGEGEDGELSSKDIQDLIDQINQDDKNQDSEGQSSAKGVDLEDFLNKVNEGEIPNDFTKHYNNPELMKDINLENQEQEPIDDFPFLNDGYDEVFDEKNYGSVSEVLKEQFKINDSELKRRFPNPDFIKDFISLLSKKEVDNLASKIGIEEDFNTLEKKNKLTTNLITEIQNL